MVFLFIIPSIPAALRELRAAPDARREGRRVPAAEPAELLALDHRRAVLHRRRRHRRRRHRLDLLHPYSTTTNTNVVATTLRRVHPRVLLDLHRAQLHRHDPQAAPRRHDLVQDAALPVGALRDGGHPGPGDAGPRDHAAPADRGAGPGRRHLRPGAGRRPGALPALLLVLLAPGGVHHDPAGDGDHQRGDLGPLAASTSSATGSSRCPRSRSRSSASSSGATTCSSPASPGWRTRSSRR